MDSTASSNLPDSNTSPENQSGRTRNPFVVETSTLDPTTTTNEEANADANVQPSAKKPPSGKLGSLTSKVWEHFTRLPSKSREDQKATCNYCGKLMKCPSINGTTVLRNHINRCKKNPLNKLDENQKTLMFKALSGDDSGTSSGLAMVTWKFDQETCRKYCARMITLDELPFRMVEHDGFRDFCKVMQPRFQVPSRFTVAKDCHELFLSEKEKLFMYLKRSKLRVCLTTDIWTSRQNLSYMCLTVHFIDQEWKLHKRILSFTPIPNHSGEVIGKCIEKHLLEWGIDKVLTITVDNASANDLAIQYVKRRLNNWKGSILKSEHLHMRCCAHIFSLTVKDGLKDLDDSIFRIRSAVRYVRSSPARLQRFKICVEQEKIESKSLVCLDVETRWNSTFLMLESALKFQSAFDRLEEQDDKYRAELRAKKNRGLPTGDDWDYVRGLLPFLKSFYDSTLRVSGSLYVTSNNYFHVVFGVGMQINDRLRDPNPNIKLMASRMKQKFDKYWGNVKNLNPLLFIAVILDPRRKMDYVLFVIDEVYDEEKVAELGNRVKVTLNALFEHYASVVGSSSEEANASSQAPMKVEEIVDVNDAEAYVLSKYKRRRAESQCKEGKSELERYLEDVYEHDDKNFDILLWWKVNSCKYPILAAMARDVLAIPVSTVASESAFSTGGRILDPFRSSLTPKMVEALICTQNWLNSAPVPIENEEKLDVWEDIETDFKELILNETRMVIDD